MEYFTHKSQSLNILRGLSPFAPYVFNILRAMGRGEGRRKPQSAPQRLALTCMRDRLRGRRFRGSRPDSLGIGRSVYTCSSTVGGAPMKKCSMALLCLVTMAAMLAYAQSADEGFQTATVVSIDKVPA